MSLVFIIFPNSKSCNNSSLKKMMKCVIDNIWHTYLFTIDPQPPGPIDPTASNFHPQTLRLSWSRSQYISNVYYEYRVTIAGHSYVSSSTSLSLWRELEPGRYYTVQIVAICRSSSFYEIRSPSYVGIIQALRKLFVLQSLSYFLFYYNS